MSDSGIHLKKRFWLGILARIGVGSLFVPLVSRRYLRHGRSESGLRRNLEYEGMLKNSHIII